MPGKGKLHLFHTQRKARAMKVTERQQKDS